MSCISFYPAETRSKSVSSPNSLYSGSPPRSEKDYFQVTDELSQENSHFSLSEALLAVMEQYKANCLEKERLVEVIHQNPPSPLLPAPSSSPSCSSPPCLLHVSNSPPRWKRPSPSSLSSLSLWPSMASIATTTAGKGRLENYTLQPAMQRAIADNSASSCPPL